MSSNHSGPPHPDNGGPWYQHPPAPPKKSKKGKIALGIIGGLILFAGCGALASDDTETTGTQAIETEVETPDQEVEAVEESPEVVEEPTTEEVEDVPTKEVAPVEEAPAYPGAQPDDIAVSGGETVALESGIEIVATPIRLANGYMDGDSYLCTTITYTNGSDKNVDLYDWDFGLQAPNGQVLDPTIPFVDGAEPLYSTELIPGGTATGDICFQNSDSVPSGEAYLIYEPMFSWSMERGVWKNAI